MKKMLAGSLAAFVAAVGIASAAYAAQTHGASNHVTVQARGGHGGGHGGSSGGQGPGHRGSNPNMQRPNEARDPYGRYVHDGLPGV
jgi:hypothetical protein